jgi:hypothetical protein
MASGCAVRHSLDKTRAWLLPLAAALGVAATLAACGNKATSGATATATEEPSADASASASALAPVLPSRANDDAKGAGVAKFVAATSKDSECKATTAELATYLMRGDLGLAGRPTEKGGEFATSYLIQLRGKAQIGFAGYDGGAKRFSRDRGIGSAHEHAPRLFSTADRWTVAWFDDDGLAYAHPTWDSTEKPPIEHMSTLKNVKPADVALAATPDGALVVASPFGTGGDQLSLFLFATSAEGQKKKSAIGVTRIAKKPSNPAVLADKTGYSVAWLEEDGQVLTARFDLEGKEIGVGVVAVGKPGKRSSLAMTQLDGGPLLSWEQDGQIFGRMLDESANPNGDLWLIGKGTQPAVAGLGDSAVVSFLGEVEGVADQVAAVRVGKTGVSESAIRVSDARTPVLDRPVVALGGPRLAFVWTEKMGPAIASKRAWIRTIDSACLK